jgi:hypothetical protein
MRVEDQPWYPRWHASIDRIIAAQVVRQLPCRIRRHGRPLNAHVTRRLLPFARSPIRYGEKRSLSDGSGPFCTDSLENSAAGFPEKGEHAVAERQVQSLHALRRTLFGPDGRGNRSGNALHLPRYGRRMANVSQRNSALAQVLGNTPSQTPIIGRWQPALRWHAAGSGLRKGATRHSVRVMRQECSSRPMQ